MSMIRHGMGGDRRKSVVAALKRHGFPDVKRKRLFRASPPGERADVHIRREVWRARREIQDVVVL